jgi:hypothetical protein
MRPIPMTEAIGTKYRREILWRIFKNSKIAAVCLWWQSVDKDVSEEFAGEKESDYRSGSSIPQNDCPASQRMHQLPSL